MEPEAEQLIQRLRERDVQAFRTVVELHSRSLWRAAWRVLGDANLAEDVVQETFLHAWRAIDRYDDRAQLSTWLHKIAINSAIDHSRRRKRREAVPLGEDVPGGVEVASEEPDPHRRALSGELAARARATIEKLPAAERTAVLLRHFEGRSIAEIARALGRDENAAKQAVFRAVKKLRRALAPHLEVAHGEPA